MALSVCCGNCLDCWFYKSPYFASLPMSLPGTKSDWSYGNYLVCWFYKSPYFASLPMSLPGTKSDWSYGNYLVCWFYKSPYFASLPMSLPGTKSDWSYGNYLVCWFYKSPYFASLPMSLPGTKSDELRQLPCLLILQVSIFWQVFMCHWQARRATGAAAHAGGAPAGGGVRGHQLHWELYPFSRTFWVILEFLGTQRPHPLPPTNSVIRLEYNVVRAAVYALGHSHNVCDTVDTELSDQPLFCNRKINTVKDFRKVLLFMHNSVLCANGFWSRKFGLEIDEHIWSVPSLVTTETRLRVLQWKILHNIDPTIISLCKMKVRDDQMCSYCNNVVDYIERFFFDCLTIKKFWNYIEQYILITFDIQTHLTVIDVLFGINQHNYGNVKNKQINHVILVVKMCISMLYLKISSGSEMFNCEKLKNENCAHCNQEEEA